MTETIYSTQILWLVLDKVHSLSYIAIPLVSFFLALRLLRNDQTWITILTFVGALMAIVGYGTHWFIDEMRWINLGYKQPINEVNKILWFLYMYGRDIGTLIFISAIFWRDHYESKESELS